MDTFTGDCDILSDYNFMSKVIDYIPIIDLTFEFKNKMDYWLETLEGTKSISAFTWLDIERSNQQ